MKYLIALLLVISPLSDLDKIARVNELKKEAKAAFTNGEYEKAIEHYTFLLDSMKVEDDNILLNLANAQYRLKDSLSLSNASNNYRGLTTSKDKVIKSVAHQQLGVMADRAKKFEEALAHFKNAIKANPANDEARYNYEMLKKMLEEQKKQNEQNQDQQNQDEQKEQDKQDQNQQNKDQQSKDQQNQNQENKDQENKEDQEQQQQQNKEEQQRDQDKKDQEQQEKNKEGDEKEEQKKPQEGEESDEEKGEQEELNSLSDKLKEMKISEEKAKMILEALKNNEIQYIQQSKKKPTKRTDPNKPDW